jgi:hypothetical protein
MKDKLGRMPFQEQWKQYKKIVKENCEENIRFVLS